MLYLSIIGCVKVSKKVYTSYTTPSIAVGGHKFMSMKQPLAEMKGKAASRPLWFGPSLNPYIVGALVHRVALFVLTVL